MFRQDRTNPSTAVSNWKGRRHTPKAWPSTAVSTWLNGGLFGGVGASFGYFTGGTPGYKTTVDKYDCTDDSRTTLGTGLSTGTYANCGFANSGVAGYSAGGNTGSIVATVDKFAFVDDSRSTLGTGLSAVSRDLGGFANSGVAGYAGGGETYPWSRVDWIDKFAFSDDGRTTLSAVLTAEASYVCGMANSGTAGYFCGGSLTTPGGEYVTTVDKIAFSDDSKSTISSGLSVGRRGAAAMANSGTAGYVAGGNVGGTVVDKIAFADDSRTTLSAGLPDPTYDPGGFANTGTAGYFGGGVDETIGYYTTNVFKWAFADDSRTALGTGLSEIKTASGAFSNQAALA